MRSLIPSSSARNSKKASNKCPAEIVAKLVTLKDKQEMYHQWDQNGCDWDCTLTEMFKKSRQKKHSQLEDWKTMSQIVQLYGSTTVAESTVREKKIGPHSTQLRIQLARGAIIQRLNVKKRFNIM